MALAAAFDLEIRQYDAVNAFTNAKIDKQIYCWPPKGFADPGHMWELRKALYRLRQSPLLWYNELKRTLEDLGLHQVPDAPYLFRNDKLFVFFYVDDILILLKLEDLKEIKKFKKKLLKRYHIRILSNLKFFYGIWITRD
jgi:Reverse transcriptase (RNA-dependent DNA polymerase)